MYFRLIATFQNGEDPAADWIYDIRDVLVHGDEDISECTKERHRIVEDTLEYARKHNVHQLNITFNKDMRRKK